MKSWRNICLILALLAGLNSHAQDPQLSQFFNAPVYVNPALVGQTYLWKFSLNTRNQWPGTSGPYVSTALTAEHNAAFRSSGVGLQLLYDRVQDLCMIHSVNIASIAR